MPLKGGVFLQETVGVDVDADADFRSPVDPCEPIADHILNIETSARMDEQALAMAASEHGQRSGSRAEHGHSIDVRRRSADTTRHPFGFRRIFR